MSPPTDDELRALLRLLRRYHGHLATIRAAAGQARVCLCRDAETTGASLGVIEHAAAALTDLLAASPPTEALARLDATVDALESRTRLLVCRGWLDIVREQVERRAILLEAYGAEHALAPARALLRRAEQLLATLPNRVDAAPFSELLDCCGQIVTALPTVPSRKLLAVVHVDVHRYTAHVRRDEAGTVDRRRALWTQLVSLVEQHRGGVANTEGDSLLALFEDGTASLACAVAMQRASAEANAAFAPDQRLELRIGVALGDVELREGFVGSEVVNLAARVQQSAAPGTILVSEGWRSVCRLPAGFTLAKRARRRFHNIDGLHAVYRVEAPDVPRLGIS